MLTMAGWGLSWLAFGISFLFTVGAMPLVFAVCRKWNFYDLPGRRKVHHNAIPRLGGALFTPALLVSMSVAAFCAHRTNFLIVHPSALILACGVFLIYLVGLVDDTVGVSARHKFLFQIAASLAMPLCHLYVNNLYGLFGLHALPVWAGMALTVLVSLVIVNAVNLIDGIDGLASGLGILSLGVFAALFARQEAWTFVLLSLALAGTLCGFFLFNMLGREQKGTKVFMGDSGSLLLGYALAYLSVKYAMYNELAATSRPEALLMPLTVVLIPVFDLVRVAAGRLMRGQSCFSADRTHLHHKLMELVPMRGALVIILLLFGAFFGLNLGLMALHVQPTWVVVADAAAFTLLVALINALIRRKARRGNGPQHSSDSNC